MMFSLLLRLTLPVLMLLTGCNTSESTQEEAGVSYTETPQPPPPSLPKQVAISLDDGPVMRFYTHPGQYERMQVIDSITTALRRYGAPATLFVVGDYIYGAAGEELMRYWLDRGIQIENHSMSHANFGELTYEQGVQEIDEATQKLKPFAADYGQEIAYFRFPYLAEGASADLKQAWADHLRRVGLTNARVTISTRDWEFDERYAALEREERWEERFEVGQAYLQHIKESVAFWDQMAQDLFGRNVKHVLLLHANRINRDYLGQILAYLQQEGYEFISLDEAYTDPLYREQDTWVSANGTSFLDHIVQTRRAAAGDGR